MKKVKTFFASVFSLALFICFPDKILSQNFSNRGTDFWVGHMGHIDGTGSNFKLYISSTVNTSGTVSVPLQGWSSPFTITANTFAIITVPSATGYVGCSDCIQQKGIHIVANDSVAVYAHIYASARSDATLLIPTPVLGKEYYAMTFKQASSNYSEFLIVATYDSTVVEITPKATTLGGQPANVPFIVTLQRGEVYQVQSQTDLTGSKILAINTDSCKKIAVFAGATWTSLGCSGAGSGDNLYEQMYPPNTWGKNFVTSPLKTRTGDMFRVMAGTNGTTVTINGVAVSLNQTQFFDTLLSVPAYITADKPVTLAQYARTQNCDGNTGDPFMIILSPVEQSINNVLLYSSPQQNITGQYINAVMKTADIGSFLLDGAPVTFNPLPANPLYSYSQNTVSPGSHTLVADSGFNSIAYGFGSIESYGYLAGTKIKILQAQTITINPQPACAGDTVSFVGTASDVPVSWKWYFGDGTTASTQNTKHVYADSGTYMVSLVTKYSSGCTSQQDSIFKTLYISGTPVANFTAPALCFGNPMLYTDSSALPHGGTLNSWLWSFGDGNNSSAQNTSHTYAVCDTFNVKLVVATTLGCKDSTTKAVIVNCLPTANFSAITVCKNQATIFNDSSSGSISFREWDFGDGSPSSNNSNPTYTYANSGTYMVTLKVTSISGCRDSITKPVQVYYNPVAGFTHNDLCLGDTVHFINTSSVDSSTSIATYLWVFGDGGATSNLIHPNHYYSIANTYNATLVTTTIDGCTNAVTHSVSAFDLPLSGFTFTNACFADSALFTNTSLNPTMGTIANWSWNFGDGTVLSPPAVGWSPHHLYSVPGNYQVTLVVYSSNLACPDTFQTAITLFPMPLANFGFTDVCLHQAMNLYDSSTVSSGSIASRSWNFGDPASGANNTSAQQNPTHVFTSAGNYTITLTLTSNNGCTATAAAAAIVHPLPHVQYHTANVCDDSTAYFNDLSSIPATDTLQSWTWNFGDNSALSTNQNTSHLYTAADSFHVQLLVVSKFGCKDSVTKTSFISPNPVVNFAATNLFGCEPLCVSFQDLSIVFTGGLAQWLWDFGDGSPVSHVQNFEHCYSNNSTVEPDTLSVSLTVTSDSGCVAMGSKNNLITVYPNPNASFSVQPQTADITDPVISIVDLSIGADFWNWNLGDHDTTTKNNPAPHTYPDTGTYLITLITSTFYGCKDTAYQRITIEPNFLFYIPNAFSPNDDGINDSFTGKGVFIKEFEMMIYDRWGNLIFFSDDTSKAWDGKANRGNEIAQQDVYVYKILITDYKNKQHNYKGIVTLVR